MAKVTEKQIQKGTEEIVKHAAKEIKEKEKVEKEKRKRVRDVSTHEHQGYPE